MKRFLAVTFAALAVTAMVGADIADARRLGGGRSLGAQRQSVAPPSSPSAAPSQTGPTGPAANPVMPAQPAAGAAASRAAPGAAAAPAAARTGMARWMGPLAGVAAGLGLAWLAHSLGLSEALLSALLIAFMVIAGIALIRMFMARRTPPRQPIPYAGGGNTQRIGGYETQPPPRTWEPAFGGTTSAPAARGRFPAGFDPEPFLDQAAGQFRRLQAAYDRGDRAALADVMTPELFAEISRDLDARTSHVATEVVRLDPEIVDVTTEAGEHWASVRFTGLLREDGANAAKPFDEMWNLVKPVDGSSGWLLAGIRQLDTEIGHA
jgi:predicted lipid-binding transport protein (Tim44 family)